MKTIQASLLFCAAILFCNGCAHPAKSTTTTARPHSAEAGEREPAKPLQGAVASKTVTFGSVSKNDELYKTALDAHELAEGIKKTDQTGAFKGTVTKIFEERDGDMLILNFDPQYRNAMCAVLKNSDFPKFPDVKTLVGKEVIISGKFIAYQNRPEILLTAPDQIKVVE